MRHVLIAHALFGGAAIAGKHMSLLPGINAGISGINQLAGGSCDVGETACNGGCMPVGGDCCADGYCDPGDECVGDGTCCPVSFIYLPIYTRNLPNPRSFLTMMCVLMCRSARLAPEQPTVTPAPFSAERGK